MRRVFEIWLIVFGLACAGIGAAHLFGGQATYIGGGTVNATMDSDLRFYSLLFLAYGLAFVWAARDIDRRATVINLLGALFFLGGLTRLLAWAASGAPTWFYIVMIPVELIVPLVNYWALRAIARREAPESTPG